MSWLDERQDHEASTEETATEQGDRLLRRGGLIVGVVCGLACFSNRGSKIESPVGLALAWSAAFLLSIVGVNRHLARFKEFWLISVCVLTAHLCLVKLFYGHLIGMSAWTLGALIIPEFVVLMIPYVWLERGKSGRAEGFNLK